MKRRKIASLGFAFVLVVAVIGGATASPTTKHVITRRVITSGGATVAGGSITMNSTLGQTIIGPVTSVSGSIGAGYWYAEVGKDTTTIWARFKEVDPNEALVEINVRQSVFYPDQPGVNYITVQGYALEQAAAPWSPPTAEQIGLIGTHWSKGWTIEGNTIRYSTCTGLTLGKHGDEFDNTHNMFGAIERALKRGWNRETIEARSGCCRAGRTARRPGGSPRSCRWSTDPRA